MYFIWYIIIGIIAGFVAGKFVWYCSNRYYGQSCNLYCGSYIIVVGCFFAQEV